MLRCLFLALALSSPALAEDWQALSADDIRAALTARILQYEDGATQNFFSDGRTLYRVTNGESWGQWWVDGDRYCSTWPPSEAPSCYGVEVSGPDIRFIGSGGDVTRGRTADP